MRSELFSQGTLMLRLVIQSSMVLALPLMAVFLYIKPELAPWYVGYVLLFNMLVGPVFSAGSVTSERERQTLELLLTTTISPWQILWAKLYSSLRISCVLTSFLIWPLLLAWLLPPWTYLHDTTTMLVYLAIITVASLTTTTLAMFCSVLCQKTSTSMITAYLIVIALFVAPIAVKVVRRHVHARARRHRSPRAERPRSPRRPSSGSSVPRAPQADIAVEPGVSLERLAAAINAETRDTGVAAVVEGRDLLIRQEGSDASLPVGFHLLSGAFETRVPATIQFRRALFVSPFAAALSMPIDVRQGARGLHGRRPGGPGPPTASCFFYLALDGLLVWVMIALFRVRWRSLRSDDYASTVRSRPSCFARRRAASAISTGSVGRSIAGPGTIEADAGGNDFGVLPGEVLRQRGANAVENHRGRRGIGDREQQSELVATKSSDKIALPQAVAQGDAGGTQHLVPRGVAPGVVYPFEVVEIEDRDARRRRPAAAVAGRGPRPRRGGWGVQ